MKLAGLLILACLFPCLSLGEMPGYYKQVINVTWLVQNIDVVEPAWVALGMSDIHEYPDVVLTGQDQGKAVKIWAWEITGHLGALTVNMIQPAEGQLNAWNTFLGKHGDGIFSIVHEVPSRAAMTQEVARMRGLGVGILQQLTFMREGKHVTYTYFDTGKQGKFVLGLVYWEGGAPAAVATGGVDHLGPVIKDLGSVSAYWQKLGFPPFRTEHATPRPDSTYRGQPLSLTFDVGYQHYDQFSYEWIVAPGSPANIYADYLKAHGEGIQHLGMPVEDLKKAVAAYEKLGYHVWQSGAWGDVGKKDSGQYDYMDTNAIGGVSVELIHAYK